MWLVPLVGTNKQREVIHFVSMGSWVVDCGYDVRFSSRNGQTQNGGVWDARCGDRLVFVQLASVGAVW